MKSVILVAAGICAGALVIRAASAPENYETHCASCHGKDGKGETKAGRKAQVKDLTDKAYQAKFDDAAAFKAIKDGMKDDKGKEKMKPYGDKLTDEEIKALIAYVRGLAK
jgi:mono/diheme cytochrome c family protein